MARRAQLPPVEFDGRFYWYTEYFDPSEDRCCACRELIPEEEVPLILFRNVGSQTWQARFCESCTSQVLALLAPPRDRG